MKVPYQTRIMAAIDGCIFEIARFRRCPTLADIRGTTSGLSATWWVEKTLNRYETITSRWQPPGQSALACSQRANHALKCKRAAA